MRGLIEATFGRLLTAAGLKKKCQSTSIEEAIRVIRPEFDVEWYVSRYPEVRDSGVDPVLHYVLTGADSGFDPHPDFNTLRYLQRYDDVRVNGINPYAHWLLFGRGEGRTGCGTRTAIAGGLTDWKLRSNAMFSVFLRCPSKPQEQIDATIKSLERQTYRNFEVILLGHASPGPTDLFAQSSRGLFCEPLLSPTDVLSSGGEAVWRGDYLMMLEAGDRLEECALASLAASAAQGSDGAGILVFDHVAGQQGIRRCNPGLDPDLLAHNNGLMSACAVSRPTFLQLSGKAGFSDLLGLVLSAAEEGVSWRHVAEILLHTVAEPVSAEFVISGDPATVGVSVIIPSCNRPDLLRSCTRFLSRLEAPFELIVVDNGSTDPEIEDLYSQLERDFAARVLRVAHEFNYSRMVNVGAAAAVHECLLLLNNDVVIDNPAAVVTALDYAMRPGVGVVGSVLRYPDGGVQHAGFVFWLDRAGNIRSEHVLRHAIDDEGVVLGALSAPRGWQAVTGAFQVVRRSVFEAVGGYDECNLPIEFNDVDFCFRLRAIGKRVVCLPLRGIVHDESSSRKSIDPDANATMLRVAHSVMKARWLSNFQQDPFFHSELRRTMGVTTLEDRSGGSGGRPAAGQRARGCFLSQGGVSPDACGPRHISPGICILGFLNSEIGLGEAARNLGRACDTARLPTSYVNRPLAKRSNEPAIETFFQRRPDRLVTLRVEGLTLEGYDFDDAGQGRFQVLYPYWELPRIPKGAIAMLDRYDEIWAGSEFIATALRAAVRKPVRLVPQPLHVPKVLPSAPPQSGRLRFLTYFDYDSHMARKNPQATIAAFRAAFPARRDVELVVKARGLDNAEARRQIATSIGGDRRIRLIDATMSRLEVSGLMGETDVFVSLHRSEGFGFGAAEALAAGKAVIATGWSATSELVTPETGFVVDYKLRPIEKSEYVYTENQVWAEPLLDSAVAQFRAVAEDPAAAMARARKGHALLLGRNSFASIGGCIAQALDELGAIQGLP